MKKKLRRIVPFALAIVMMFGVTSTAMAAGSVLTEPGEKQNYTATSPNSKVEADIYVYGYVGEDAVISDPKPGMKAVEPVIIKTGTDVSVSVPTKVVWAAFASDAGDITSPEYKITNNSSKIDLDAYLVSFTSSATADNTAVDSKLVLDMSSTKFSKVQNLRGISSKINLGILSRSETWDFKLSGRYTGVFGKSYEPKYNMVLEFKLSENELPVTID